MSKSTAEKKAHNEKQINVWMELIKAILEENPNATGYVDIHFRHGVITGANKHESYKLSD